jgi:hypothetical protein
VTGLTGLESIKRAINILVLLGQYQKIELMQFYIACVSSIATCLACYLLLPSLNIGNCNSYVSFCHMILASGTLPGIFFVRLFTILGVYLLESEYKLCYVRIEFDNNWYG